MLHCKFLSFIIVIEILEILEIKSYTTWFPVDTGRELKIHKTFRGCPGRLLNVLRTFTLRPVSAGFELSLSIWRKLIHELFGFNHDFLGG